MTYSYDRVCQKVYISLAIFAIWEVKVAGNMFMQMFVCPVQIISGLDDQSKLQMFTVFSRRHIGAPQMCTNMADPYWALYKICAKHFDEYLKFGITHRPKTWRDVLFTYFL